MIYRTRDWKFCQQIGQADYFVFAGAESFVDLFRSLWAFDKWPKNRLHGDFA
jgi:hypothetical protein